MYTFKYFHSSSLCVKKMSGTMFMRLDSSSNDRGYIVIAVSLKISELPLKIEPNDRIRVIINDGRMIVFRKVGHGPDRYGIPARLAHEITIQKA